MKSTLAFFLLLSMVYLSEAINYTLDQQNDITLADVLAELSGGNYTPYSQVVIDIHRDLEIRSVIHFTNFSFTLQGLPSVSEISCKSQNAGLVFMFLEKVQLLNLRLSGCGTNLFIYNDKYQYRSAIHVSSCGRFEAYELTVQNSNGTGLLLHLVGGENDTDMGSNITSSNFLNNTMFKRPDDEYIRGGGGVILFVDGRSNSQFHFNSCKFEHNLAANTRDYSYIFVDESGMAINGSGRGGGMFVNIVNGSQNNTVLLSHCNFTRNHALTGQGLSAEIEDNNTAGNTIQVEESNFDDNGCDTEITRSGSGGGVMLSYQDVENTTVNNLIAFHNVSFKSNCALLGGGTYFFSDPHTNPHANNSVIFKSCEWIENTAFLGSAVDTTPQIFKRNKGVYRPQLTFEDCKFINNSISTSNIQHESYGSSTFYSSLYDVTFVSSTQFHDNKGTALQIFNAVADMRRSSAEFYRNTGTQGGAVTLTGSSSLWIGENRYNFTNNTAIDRGGAIYSYLIDSHDFLVSRTCFLVYFENMTRFNRHSSEWKAEVHFEGNVAKSGQGNDIFTTSLIPCKVVRDDNQSFVLLDDDIFVEPGVTFHDKYQGCENFRISTDGAYINLSNSTEEIIPGDQHRLGFKVMNDLSNEVPTTLIASFPGAHGDILVDNSSTCLTNKMIELRGTPNQRNQLLLQSTSTRRIFAYLDIKLVQCPPGFVLENDTCSCDALSHSALTRCNRTHSFLRIGYWAGYVNVSEDNEKFITDICPFGFCDYTSSVSDNSELEVVLPQSAASLNRRVCGPERSGVLCGVCNEGYVVNFHSPYYKCTEQEGDCMLGWLFYILSEILPVTVLYVVILFFDISFTSGALNGFILFSQLLDTLLIDASGIISFSGPIRKANTVQRIIYGFFNLNFFYADSLSFCLWKRASVLDIIAFKYLTIGYSVLLIAGVIMFMRYCGTRFMGRLIYHRSSIFRNSVIQGLSAFLVICYTQCIKISFSLLYAGRLEGGDVVWYKGDVKFFSRGHLPYAIPALLILLTVGVIPPFLLVFYPAFFRVAVCLRIPQSCIDKTLPLFTAMKPFLDVFQGCFKDNFRFFAGLYFIYRWVGVLVLACVHGFSTFYTIIECFLIVMLVLHALCQPYVKRWHNILDTVLIANLAIINQLTNVSYYGSNIRQGRGYQEYINDASITQIIFIYMPILYLLLYAAVRMLRKACLKNRNSSGVKEAMCSLVKNQDKPGPEKEDLSYSLVKDNITASTSFIDVKELELQELHL